MGRDIFTVFIPAASTLAIRFFLPSLCGHGVGVLCFFIVMIYHIGRCLHVELLIAALLSLFLWHGADASAETSAKSGRALEDKYNHIADALAKSPLGIPVMLQSTADRNSSSVEFYGIIDSPFDSVQQALTTQAVWCDIVLLHVNARACIHSQADDKRLLTLYNVNKYYQPIEDASQLQYQYRIIAKQPGYLQIHFIADDGPFRSHDHRLQLEAILADEHRTFVHLSYSYRYSSFSYMTMTSYYAIFGGGKVGFSIVGTDRDGNPLYVGGIRGAGERNVMRYYLAVMAYMETLQYPAEQRFERRISRWYDLASRYKQQLFMMEKREYLDYKRRDLKSQIMLQNASMGHLK